MNLLDVRGLLLQKAGKNNGDSKTCPLVYLNFCKWHGSIASDADFYPHFRIFLIIRMPERHVSTLYIEIIHKN